MPAPTNDPALIVRRWIVEVLRAHLPLMHVAVRQRAKFEGWLKFEIASMAEQEGVTDVHVETAAEDESGGRADLTFSYNSHRCDVELKTCNTNWRMTGVANATRPITKNIAAIIKDALKLRGCNGYGIVAFCIFPVPSEDCRWVEYLNRISAELGIPLTAEANSERVRVALGSSHADVVVVSFTSAAPQTKRFVVSAGG